jgi:predicted transcriptional regulator
MADEQNIQLIELTGGIAASYVASNTVSLGELPALINAIHAALRGVGQPVVAAVEERPIPAVSIRKSLGEDFLICLEDGRKFRSLKRHLRTKYNMSPEDYRAKWSLPKDYPMVAPSYAASRSALAKEIGLGTGGRKAKIQPANATRGRAKAVATADA